MADEREEGISFSEIFQVIKKRIWYILGITVLIALLITVVVAFWYNPCSRTYSMTFRIESPDSSASTYPDGSPFNFNELISEDVLLAVQAQDEQFADVDVEDMLAENAISVAVYVEEDEDVVTDGETYYVVTVSGSYFDDEEMATAFLRAVGDYQTTYINRIAAALDYGLDEGVFDSATTFEMKYNMLVNLKSTYLSYYNSWISKYSELFMVGDKTLSYYKSALEVVFDSETQSMLSETLSTYEYVPASMLSEKIELLKSELAVNEAKITQLEALLESTQADYTGGSGYIVVGDSSDSTIISSLVSLTTRNSEIEYILEILQSTDIEDRLTAFDAQLKEQYTQLAAAAETLKTVTASIYEANTKVYFTATNAEEDGTISTILVAAASLVLVFIAACVVYFCVDYKKLKEGEKEVTATAEGAKEEGEPAEKAEKPEKVTKSKPQGDIFDDEEASDLM